MCKSDTLGEAILQADERRHKLGGVDLTTRHSIKLSVGMIKILLQQFACVFDRANHTDGKGSEA